MIVPKNAISMLDYPLLIRITINWLLCIGPWILCDDLFNKYFSHGM